MLTNTPGLSIQSLQMVISSCAGPDSYRQMQTPADANTAIGVLGIESRDPTSTFVYCQAVPEQNWGWTCQISVDIVIL